MASRAAKKQRMMTPQSVQPAKQEKPLTIKDMQEVYVKGYNAGFDKGREVGFKQASTTTVQCMFGAVVISAHALFGFGQERCIRLLNRVYQTTLETMTTTEMAQRAFDEVGVEIDWTEPVEVAQAKPPIKKEKRT